MIWIFYTYMRQTFPLVTRHEPPKPHGFIFASAHHGFPHDVYQNGKSSGSSAGSAVGTLAFAAVWSCCSAMLAAAAAYCPSTA